MPTRLPCLLLEPVPNDDLPQKYTQAVGNNPDLLFPIKLGGELCRPSDLLPCTASDASALELATVCCTELFDSSSSGPEELISTLEAVGYVLIIPGEGSQRDRDIEEEGAGAETGTL